MGAEPEGLCTATIADYGETESQGECFLLQQALCENASMITHFDNVLHLFVSYPQQAGYNFLSKMQAFDPKDKDSIFWGLMEVFKYNDNHINKKIAEQVHCIGWIRGSGIVGLTRNSRRWPMRST